MFCFQMEVLLLFIFNGKIFCIWMCFEFLEIFYIWDSIYDRVSEIVDIDCFLWKGWIIQIIGKRFDFFKGFVLLCVRLFLVVLSGMQGEFCFVYIGGLRFGGIGRFRVRQFGLLFFVFFRNIVFSLFYQYYYDRIRFSCQVIFSFCCRCGFVLRVRFQGFFVIVVLFLQVVVIEYLGMFRCIGFGFVFQEL